MVRPLLPDDLWIEIALLLPPPRPRPKGGRPPNDNRAALTGILFVPRSGLPWEMLPSEMGCGCGMSCSRRLRDWRVGAATSSAAEAPARGRRDRLRPREPGQCLYPGQKGGPATGPNPPDRGKPGTKRNLFTDARGTPLMVNVSNRRREADGRQPARQPRNGATLDAIPPLGTGRRGRPSRRPDKLHADKAYDGKARWQECRTRGIVPRIARKGIESSEKLGRHRWVVGRTHAWFNRFRRLPIRYERRANIYEAFTSLAASLITLNQINRFCYAL